MAITSGNNATGPVQRGARPEDPHYRWVALFLTTLGMMMATIDGTIMLIALPDIFRGIGLDPLRPGNSFYLLWMILSFLVVTSVLVVSLGRLGDIFGRVKMYNLGFAIFTFFSLLLTVTWMSGQAAGIWLVAVRVLQGVGAAFLMANSAAIITDAFPFHQRGMALGINQAAGISGSFIGLVLGGVLAPIDWRLIFLVSVPIGLFGTIWGYRALHEVTAPRRAHIDWVGNLTFFVGLVLIMVGITYGIEPYRGSTMGWMSPAVLTELLLGAAFLALFAVVEIRARDPMFRLRLFRLRAFTGGVLAGFLAALGRGGLMFMLIIWLQGIWLPLHGYAFSVTPLWAGVFMMPMTAGFMLAGPVSGTISDRIGPRWFTVGGMVLSAVAFLLLELLPIDFPYWAFGVLLFMMGISMGSFSSPNRAAVMNSLPAADRGAGSGMNTTFQNSAQVLSIGVFFSLMIAGLAASLPQSLFTGLVHEGVPAAAAHRVSELPPVSTLFAAFLGYDPVQHLLGGGVLAHLTASQRATLTGRSFFPGLISAPFRQGLRAAFDFSIVACLVAAAMSWSKRNAAVPAAESEVVAAPVAGGSRVMVPSAAEVSAAATSPSLAAAAGGSNGFERAPVVAPPVLGEPGASP